MLKKIATNSLLTLFGVVVALCMAELFLSIFPFPRDATKPAYCGDYDNETVARYTYSMSNYAYQPNAELPTCATDFLVVNTSDADGYLGNPSSSVESRTLVFGDSFAYGFGVKKEESFALIIGAYNAGLWGNSFPNHARVLERLLQRGKKFDVAVWVIYPSHLITVSDGGWATRTNVTKEAHSWLYWLAEKYNETRLSKALLATLGWGVNNTDYYTKEWSLYDEQDKYVESGYRKFENAAKEIKEISAAHKIKVIPLIIPSKRQIALKLDGVRPLFKLRSKLDADLPDRRLTEILEYSGFPKADQIFIFDEITQGSDKQDWRKYYWANDAHLTVDGNKFVARIVQEKIDSKINWQSRK